MAVMDRPRQVVFNLLKQTWGIEHQDTLALLATDYIARRYNDERKPARSREIVNVEPEKYYPDMFKPFEQTSAALVSTMHSAKRGPHTNPEIIAYMKGEACDLMRMALDRCGADGVYYANATTDIADDKRLSDTDKAHLLVLLFCSAGCTGDVRAAVDEALGANRGMGARFATTPSDGSAEQPVAMRYDFALLRIDAGGQGGRHVLSTDPEGTEIGRQASAANCITDVDMPVSKRHAHVWRDDDGLWWVQGLGSTNGSYLIDGATREIITVEPPQTERSGENDPVELHLGDILVLAETTQFWVQAV